LHACGSGLAVGLGFGPGFKDGLDLHPYTLRLDIMGGDCCGGSTPSSSAQMGGMPAVEAVKESLVEAHGDSGPVETPKYQEDFSAHEFKEYCQRRVDLFLKYKQRQDGKVLLTRPVFKFRCRARREACL
jgi:hypothetical protein